MMNWMEVVKVTAELNSGKLNVNPTELFNLYMTEAYRTIDYAYANASDEVVINWINRAVDSVNNRIEHG